MSGDDNSTVIGIGKAMLRLEDRRLTTGRGRFGGDLYFPGGARMAILRSPHAHADIVSIDTTAASELPGVIAIYTGADLEADGLGYLPVRVTREAPSGGQCFVPPYSALAMGRVRHVGEAIAAVVAETEEIAKDALEHIEIEFEPLESVADVSAAVDPAAITIWEESPRNECFLYRAGDAAAVERAFEQAHHITRLDFRVSRVSANPLEPRNATGIYDQSSDRYTLHSADQSPHILRNELAETVLRVPEHRLQIISPDCGGSFGMKYGPYPEQALVLWASRKIGRPVSWCADRSEAFLSDHHARDNVSTVELALDADGRFLALRVSTLANLGAYLDAYGIHTPTNNVGGLAGTYTTPCIAVDVTGVFTNTNPTSAYRGAGRPEASYAIERVIDIAAAEMGIDRIELRRRNMIPPEMMPFRTGLLYTYDSGEFERNMDRVLQMSDWSGFEERRAEAAARGKLRGIGLASVIEIAGGPLARPAEEYAEIRFDQSGHVQVLVGTVPQGQGHQTTLAQLVGEFLGVPASQVRIEYGDTDRIAFGRGTFGSRTAAAIGATVRVVADKLIERGKLIASHLLEVDAAELDFADGSFCVVGTDLKIGIQEIARVAYKGDLLPRDVQPGFHDSATVALSAPTFPNGCHVCEVEIDPDTGSMSIVGYWVVDDVGKMLNPMLVKGQMIGGIAQGIGQAVGEQIRYDEEGQLLSGTFQDYFMPKAIDMPRVEIEANEVPAKTNPLGVKGVGEAGTVGALPVVINAVNDALRVLGVRHFEMPATPTRLWSAIHERHAVMD